MQVRGAKQFELLQQLPGKVRDRMRAGLTEDQAIEAVAAGQCCPVLTVKAWWEKFLRQQRQEHRMARDARILKLASQGWPNTRIAKALNPPLHHVTISRILQRQVKAAAKDKYLSPPQNR